jgi:putative iron-only hydrogenase system regulator
VEFFLKAGNREMETRIGVVGIVIQDRIEMAPRVNEILSAHADIIVGRMGIPYREKNICVISLIVDGTTDAVGSLTGKLGVLPGVEVRSCLTGRR